MSSDLEISFFDHNRQRREYYDFGKIGCDVTLSEDIKDAFIQLTGHYNSRSRMQAWRSIKGFMDFLTAHGIRSTDKNKDLLSRYASELSNSSRLRKTNGSHYNFVYRLVTLLSESCESEFWRGQALPSFDFTREKQTVRDNEISLSTLKNIAEACKKEINEIRACIAVRQAIETGVQVKHPSLDASDIKALAQLIALESKGIWSQREMADAKKGRLGSSGLRRLSVFKELTIRTCIPLFLLLMIESAANPIALMEVKFNCIEPHPTDESMIFFSWDKPRSNKEQSLPFIKNGKFSPSELVSLIKLLTQPIRYIVENADKDLLFIVRTGSKSRRLSVQSLHNKLKEFRDEHNIEYFTFSDIRKAVANVIAEEYKTIKPVSRFLQHSDETTTNLYLRGRAALQRSFERVSEFQGEMINMVQLKEQHVPTPYSTLFGMSCKSPTSGIAEGSRVGTPCVEFTQCATCKNAVIIHDEPHYVARLLKSREALEKLEKDSSCHADKVARFDKVFRESLHIIRDFILPKVSKRTMDEAEVLVSDIPDIPLVY